MGNKLKRRIEMKVYRVLILFFVSLAFLFSWSVVSNVEAASIWPTASATLCWQASYDGVPLGIIRLRSVSMGGVYYLLSGKISTNDGKSYIGHGTAQVNATRILITVNGSGKSAEDMETGTAHVILSASTLNGSWETMGQDFNYIDESTDMEHETGKLTKIPCP